MKTESLLWTFSNNRPTIDPPTRLWPHSTSNFVRPSHWRTVHLLSGDCEMTGGDSQRRKGPTEKRHRMNATSEPFSADTAELSPVLFDRISTGWITHESPTAKTGPNNLVPAFTPLDLHERRQQSP